MTIQVILSGLLAGIGILVAVERSISRLLRAAVLVVAVFGIVLVWVPTLTDRIAHLVGVGRGADLILYVWVVITLALIVSLYLKIVQLSRKLTQISRAVALDRPRFPDGDDKSESGVE